MTTEQIKQEITVKLMSDNQEMIADCLQPLLDIAEGKKDIEEWNKFATTLIEKVDRIEAETRKQVAGKIYNTLLNNQEFVIYKSDNGHGIAVPMREIIGFKSQYGIQETEETMKKQIDENI